MIAGIMFFFGLFLSPVSAGERCVPLFEDTSFRCGFLLLSPDPSKGRRVECVLKGKCGKETEGGPSPNWYLAQWATKFSLRSAPCRTDGAGSVWYENEGKKVVVGAGEKRDLILEIRGKPEYGERARKRGESWPHLLVEQDAKKVFSLDRLKELRLRGAFRLLYFKDHMKKKADPSLHAGQFQLFLVVKNIDPRSADHGNYFWFGVPFFDNRRDFPGPYRAEDAGKADATHKLIYTISSRNFLSSSLKDNLWHRVDIDLLPFIKKGIAYGTENGFLRDSDPSHYAVVNMNMGWEIPGIYDGAMQVRDLVVAARVGE